MQLKEFLRDYKRTVQAGGLFVKPKHNIFNVLTPLLRAFASRLLRG